MGSEITRQVNATAVAAQHRPEVEFDRLTKHPSQNAGSPTSNFASK